MSDYYVGPFGRMLPVDGSAPERDQDRPANLPAPTTHPYQLPPPRTSGPLPFLDVFPRQREPGERSDSGVGLYPKDAVPQPNGNKQLPSVSQLLIPPSHSSPPSPYQPQTYRSPTPNTEFRESPHSLRPNDIGFGSRLPLGAMHDRVKGHSDPFPRRPSGNLPPITHVSSHSQDFETPPHHAMLGSSPIQSYQHGPLAYNGVMFHDQGPRGEMSSAEGTSGIVTPTRSQVPRVRPHVVDERYIDGEGLCYIYADGTHCPKLIDGVHVNANWGITKAGKPRKRLAQACLTCREKKIKCQPNLPKCDQCQKSGRECRFESAPRGNRTAMKASHLAGRYDSRDGVSPSSYTPSGPSSSIYSAVPASESSTSLPGTNGQSPISDGSIVAPFAGDGAQERMDVEQSYKTRFPGLSGSSAFDDSSKRPMDEAHVSPDYAEILMEVKDIGHENPLVNDWNTDPYEADPESTMHYIESYFTHVNGGLHYMFPKGRFFLWLKSCQTKSLSDKMLLYWMMTLGTVFSHRPDRLMALKRYSRTARYAVEHYHHGPSLQLAQSRLIMSLWYYAIGAPVECWDSVGAAVRTVCGLRYNVELGGVFVEPTRVCEYGLHPQALIECRRRTFWVAFLMDRFSGFHSPSPTFISSQMILLRLPCREEIYEAQQYATVPYYQGTLDHAQTSSDDGLSSLSPMAFLVEIASLLGEVSHNIFRLSLNSSETYGRLFDEFYMTVAQRSNEWAAKLPDHLKSTVTNLETSIRAKKADTFMSIHLIHHATLMKLNRHVRYLDLPPGTVDQYVRRARHHAVEILQMSVALNRYASDYESARLAMEPTPPKTTMLNPFLGYVILSAVDVVSAGGLIGDLPESISLIKGSLDPVRDLGRIWDGALSVVSLIETRVDAMVEYLNHRANFEDKIGFTMDSPSLDRQVSAGVSKYRPRQPGSEDEDLMYGLPRDRFFRALGVDLAFSEDHILWFREDH
ncbi:hypothetical protein MW887_007705 [Aspergillus wentii]|nr:hypothetical protein MW887_007705 [Aspergillus wentii]